MKYAIGICLRIGDKLKLEWPFELREVAMAIATTVIDHDLRKSWLTYGQMQLSLVVEDERLRSVAEWPLHTLPAKLPGTPCAMRLERGAVLFARAEFVGLEPDARLPKPSEMQLLLYGIGGA